MLIELNNDLINASCEFHRQLPKNLMKSQFPKTDGWWVGFTYIMPIGTSLGLVRQVENLTEMVERCSDWHNPCRDAEQKGCSFESHFAVSDNKCRPTSTRVGEIFEGFMTSFSRRFLSAILSVPYGYRNNKNV